MRAGLLRFAYNPRNSPPVPFIVSYYVPGVPSSLPQRADEKAAAMTPEDAALLVTQAAAWELEFQLKRLDTVPGERPLTVDQQRQHSQIFASLGVALDAAAVDGPSGIVAVGLKHVALLAKKLADELGVPRTPFPFEIDGAVR
jgi:hypothetical protein